MFDTILPHLDERATRLLLAAEARTLGHGGMAAVTRASGAAGSRAQQGVNELEAGIAPLQGVRRPGTRRKTLTEKDPDLVQALLALVEPTRRGDPESPLSCTTLSTAKLAGELTDQGHQVVAETELAALATETDLTITVCHLPRAPANGKNRAQTLLPHLHELARATPDQPRS